ncbi:ribonuclease H-like domain-containing protein [Tanacetum coccineum]|uniref:Ribonuclease H-like domain-containing protein n=1 Tax=Tanacetum coccineum TaxID=301880 RepID=A0ABQ4WII0_9ASTR
MGMVMYQSPQNYKVKSKFASQDCRRDTSQRRSDKKSLGVSTEDANQKFLRSLPSAWSQVSLIMRTKPGVDSLSFDDLYNNLRVFENDVKGSTASSSSTQNVAFVSENTSSTNDVSTAYSVSNPSGQNSQYEQTSSYSLLANQSSCPQLDHEDLEQLDEYDLEEMDLKWQVAMISMRMKKFYKKTGRKLQFDAKEPVGFDKTKVECYNCHKTGHFARECRTKGNQDGRRKDAWNSGNKDGRRSGKQEDSKALVTIDGEGVDWTSHSEEEEDYALMACNSSGSDTEVTSCSHECKESYAKLKKLYDAQREQLSDASIEIKAYTQGLKKVEAQLVAHQQGQLWYEQKIKFMKIDLDDKTDVLTYHKKLLAEAQKEKEDLKAKVEKWHNSSKNLGKLLNTQMSANDKFGLGYGDHRYDGILSYENEVLQSVFMNKESELEKQPLYDRFVTAGGMHVVPPPMTGNYMPSGPDIEVDYSQFTYGPKQTQPSESETQTSEFDTCESNISTEPSELVVNESNIECQPKVWYDAPIIEEYESDSEDEDCDFHPEKEDWLNKAGVINNGLNKNCWSKRTKNVSTVPLAVQTRTGNNPVNTAKASSTNNFSTARQNVNRQTVLTSTALKVNTVKPIVNGVRPANVFHKTHSPSSRPFKRTTVLRTNFSNQKVYTAKVKEVSTVGGKWDTADNPHRTLKNKGIIDSGCSRHMTGNKAYLADFQDFNGGPVAFGGSKGYITGKGKIKTGKLDFEDVSFVKELQHFNLFSVSQMCDKKNKVLFTDSECLVLSPDFKLPDENQILLKVPRQNNMYSFNLENIVPLGGLACLIAKATTDESNKWHRRLGHVNFKNLNRLVKGNLVRGLPTKLFQNDHTCVACQKGKQHKASCKAKLVSSISHTLQLLHMDLFGPTSVRSINHKTYCLVITDDFSRFSWTFFLRTKDETSAILKDFIRQIENQLNQKGSRGNTAMPELHNKMELLRERTGPLLRQRSFYFHPLHNVDESKVLADSLRRFDACCTVPPRLPVPKCLRAYRPSPPPLDQTPPLGSLIGYLRSRAALGALKGKSLRGYYALNLAGGKFGTACQGRARAGGCCGVQGKLPLGGEVFGGGKNNHFAGLDEFRQRVEGLLEKQEEKLRKLSIEYDEELCPHMLSAIAERSVIGTSPDVAQLQVPIFSCLRDILNPFALEREIPLKESLEAHAIRLAKKKGVKGKAILCGVGAAYIPRSDGVPVSVATVLPKDSELLGKLEEAGDAAYQVGRSEQSRCHNI